MTAELRRLIADAWAFRALVEQEAALRFDRLAAAIAGFDTGSPVVPLMRRAAEDERRHAGLCAQLALRYGHPTGSAAGGADEIAPAQLEPRQAVLYEVVAACCITETESMATVATLLATEAEPPVREILHEIARDEVIHSRMGWAHLSREAAATDVSFLAEWIPVMLAGTVDDSLFGRADAEQESEELLRHGVLPHRRKREIFVGTLVDVVFPGLERVAVDTAPARTWLAGRAGGAP